VSAGRKVIHPAVPGDERLLLEQLRRRLRQRACLGRRAALVVPPRDSRVLAAAINRLLEDEALRRETGEAGYVRAKSEFTLERMWEGMLNVYRSLNVEQGTENSE